MLCMLTGVPRNLLRSCLVKFQPCVLSFVVGGRCDDVPRCVRHVVRARLHPSIVLIAYHSSSRFVGSTEMLGGGPHSTQGRRQKVRPVDLLSTPTSCSS